MEKIRRGFRPRHAEQGASLLEYTLLLGLILIASFAAVETVGLSVFSSFDNIVNQGFGAS